jgi:hypothetical protein
VINQQAQKTMKCILVLLTTERIQIDFGANVEGLLKATAKDTA